MYMIFIYSTEKMYISYYAAISSRYQAAFMWMKNNNKL